MSAMTDLEELVQKGIEKIAINRSTIGKLRLEFLRQAEKVSAMLQRKKSLENTL